MNKTILDDFGSVQTYILYILSWDYQGNVAHSILIDRVAKDCNIRRAQAAAALFPLYSTNQLEMDSAGFIHRPRDFYRE